MFYCTYQLGSWILQTPSMVMPDELTWAWISAELSTLWQPFLLGSVITGLLAAGLGYGLTMPYWRWWVPYNWRKRQEARRQR